MLALTPRTLIDGGGLDGSDRRGFWVAALRNRQLGLWAAHMMEMEFGETDDYVDEIVALGLQAGGDVAIVDKLTRDFARAGMDVPAEVIGLEMARRTVSAEKHLRPSPEFPEAA